MMIYLDFRCVNERCKVLNIEMGDSDEIIVLSGNNAHRRRRSKDPEPSKL